MQKFIFITLLAVINTSAFSQINWYRDFTAAKEAAKSEGKLLLVDFWADWCGPCKKMDKDLWNSSEIEDATSNFIAYKLDVDVETNLAIKFKVQGIPRVMIITPNEEIIWDKTGFAGANEYSGILKTIPTGLESVYSALNAVEKEDTEQNLFEVALAYQAIGENLDESYLANKFFQLSDEYLRKASKGDDVIISELAELNLILNVALQGNAKRALKKIVKVENPTSEFAKEFGKYIRAYCYKCEGLNEEYLKEKSVLTNQELLVKLSDN